MRLITGLFITLVLAVGTPRVIAQGRGKGKPAQSNVADDQNLPNDRKATVAVSVSIGRNDERIIREWFSQSANMSGLPPGLAKKEQLPPGLQKHLARNGQLPPGLQKKIQPLPPALEARLTRLPEGKRRIIFNGSVILLDERRNFILDMIGVF
jgi:hypothetical protein